MVTRLLTGVRPGKANPFIIIIFDGWGTPCWIPAWYLLNILFNIGLVQSIILILVLGHLLGKGNPFLII
jgi:hypothetical protein